MGQTIDLKERSVLGRLAIFEVNRTLASQVGEAFAGAEETELVPSFPARLARRLFEAVPELDHVFVAGSSVTVRTKGEWSAEAHEKIVYEIRNFFVHWAENRT